MRRRGGDGGAVAVSSDTTWAIGPRCGLTAAPTTLTAATLAASTALATTGAGREHLNCLRGDRAVLAGRPLHHHSRSSREVRPSAGRGLLTARSPLLNVGLLGELDCDGAALGGDRQRVAGQGLDRAKGAATTALSARTRAGTLSCPALPGSSRCARALPGLAAGALLRCLHSSTLLSSLAGGSELPAAGSLGLRRRLFTGK